MNPHMHLGRTARPPVDAWRCEMCGNTGTMNEIRSRPCGHTYEPCKACGQTPECAIDCPAIVTVLADQKVYIIGAPPDLARAIERHRARGCS